ncbi:probable protein ABIL5 isoform X2 [Manihot esculenta]|uniref:Uncharacterized protein n=9 Tax=Manihot esculenta TaxID=3983 RepID=A0ACB7G929_MANES|nr:probable protein ABIL5 isoform X2 [Manihot esculenta]KAG8636256.1 hypothetical protein MANES_16G114100v8 [Manihot esculenta]KAG8636257.1 hypothetical protein MANES_16G114100v8 [Manihot esculenta]KAG8636258.1 hypothetical protein MANES_16G114100v8 [Manihot esculenta]KAG8636259.1 hypothetical protein MANES_16G114100v8 [Manihot esculenta]KAG8636260.1 hypothetical protein MANES_16G114100v8 [Manihot esculenta]
MVFGCFVPSLLHFVVSRGSTLLSVSLFLYTDKTTLNLSTVFKSEQEKKNQKIRRANCFFIFAFYTQLSTTSACRKPDSESENIMSFDKSLQELRDLRSQLHYAADYCESTFLNVEEKKLTVENTKEYIRRAVVSVVDHLGCISANLNHIISKNNEFSEAELRINTLKQRLLSCEQYAHKLALTRVRWKSNWPKFHRRYLSTPITNVEIDKSNGDERNLINCPDSPITKDKHGFKAEDLPLHLYKCALPVRDGLSVLSKGPIPTFHFQEISQKHGRYRLFRQSANSSGEISSLIRRIKRTT